jgi:uncharacterized Fe-S center protein
MTDIKVTQEDRIVAAMTVGFVRRLHASSCAFADGFEDGILRGVWDNHEMVQMSARHRIAQIERDAAIAKAEFKGHHFETAAVVIESKILEQLK